MSVKRTLLAHVKRTPAFLWVREAHVYASAARRAARAREEKDLDNIVSQIGSMLQEPLYDAATPTKTVLMMGMSRVRFVAQESAVRKAFELAGYRCRVMLPQDRIAIKAYQKLGSDQLLFPDFYFSTQQPDAARLLADCKTLDDVTAITVSGVRCGKYAVSTLMRKTRSGTFDVNDAAVRVELEKALLHSMRCAQMAIAVVDDVKPQALVLVDRGYSPSGEFFDVCVARDIAVITWNAAHKNDTLMLKRYTASNRDVHPSSLSDKTWQMIQTMPWSAQQSQEISNELDRCYNSGEWYAEVGTQFNKKKSDRAALTQQLNLDPNKKIAVIFPHIFWDATFFWGDDLFENYEDWFIQTVQAACKNDKLNWIIKVHPANLVKNHRDGVVSEHSEITAIRKAVGTLPPHVHVMPADTDISTLSLFSMIDCCVTVRGTVGIEAACFGVPVLTAGTGRFDRLGFTIDSDSKEEYLARLAQADKLEKMPEKQQELARRYAYGFLLMRPAQLTSYQMRFKQNATADLQVDYQVHSAQVLRNAPDLQAMASWIRSGDEDYLQALPVADAARKVS